MRIYVPCYIGNEEKFSSKKLNKRNTYLTKSILFSGKRKIKKASPLNIQYKDIKIKQYSKVTYLGCVLDETLSGESMAIYK